MNKITRKRVHEYCELMVAEGVISELAWKFGEDKIIDAMSIVLNHEFEQDIKDSNRGDWRRSLFSWTWNILSIQGCLGWDRHHDDQLYFVMLRHIGREKNKDPQSRLIRINFDDRSSGLFAQRDWTKSGLPFVDTDEVYWSGWWFQFREDAEKFLKIYIGDNSPILCTAGMGNWQDGYKEFERKQQIERAGDEDLL